jgi:uncharacterized protein YxjI
MSNSFFNANNYFIDEKVNLFKFENTYQVYDEQGAKIGAVIQKLSTGQKILQLFVNKKMLPFHLEIKNSNDQVEATISRGWTLFLSKISIHDKDGALVGSLSQKFRLLKPAFKISDGAGEQVAEIAGDWKAWNFSIKDAAGTNIGSISKKWAGAMKEIFTTADKYHVAINPDYSSPENKTVILACAITIDMVMKESK